MEWYKRFSHLECLCFTTTPCLHVCVRVYVYVLYVNVYQSSLPDASEKGFWEKQKAGEVMATGKREHQAPLFSALGSVTSPSC